ncbi:FkbM family methyltransferase [Natronocella acetinitrilica]|uniref:FkbM family methyltransferase n=2 Tax=Natronocella acetinitrilica TaxID=414046 RepID=A0AAE3G1M7_9GAMM|nr:FkbM family methyltransferase [Natronocella acetinitrilica]
MRTLLRSLPFEIRTFVDVGANIGQSLLSYKSVCPEGRYVGFEPNPFCVVYVHELASESAIRNFEIVPAGLSDEPRVASLHVGRRNLTNSGATLETDLKDVARKVAHPVCLYRLDDISDEFGFEKGGLVLKIDAESHESKVFRGASSFIGALQPLIIAEVLPPRDSNDVGRMENISEINALLESLQYEIYKISITPDRDLSVLQKIDYIPAEPVSKELKEFNRDYVFAPKSLHSELLKIKLARSGESG